MVLLAIPQFASPYTNLQLTLILVYGVAILGLDVLVGRAGQVSLGQSAFVGLGAYAAAYAFGHGWGPVAALALAVALAGVVAVLVAIPAVRLRGFAFGIITLALPAFAVPLANRLVDLTGGSQGVAVVATTAPEWTGQADDQWRLYLVGVVAAIVFWLVHNLLDGRLGRALAAIRVNEAMAAANGVAVHRNKVLAFTVAGLCGGVAGWLYLIAVQFVSPAHPAAQPGRVAAGRARRRRHPQPARRPARGGVLRARPQRHRQHQPRPVLPDLRDLPAGGAVLLPGRAGRRAAPAARPGLAAGAGAYPGRS